MKRWMIACSCLLPVMASAKVDLSPQSTLFVDPQEPAPIQTAVRDLGRDWQMVFGEPLRVIHDPGKAAATTLWVALDHEVPRAVTRPSGWEQLHLQAVTTPWPGSPARQALVLTGSDVRGTIYAIYQFSQEFLGVDPLYWWTDHEPDHRTAVDLPDSFRETEGPVFHYRGFFVNDEDLLTGWRSGIPDQTGISLATWDRVFEAVLRLKADMVIPGTWIFPYEPQIQAAVARGLVVSQHHVNVLGLDTYRWPKDKPYSFSNDPALLEAAWKRSIGEYPKDAEIVWSVGYRGQNDYPFWLVDKNAPSTDAGRAQVIRAAIDKEIQVLRQSRPQAPIIMNAWQEAAGFIHQGLLKIPDGVTLVWPDNGHGLIQDAGEISRGQGVYYHTAMFDYHSDHFSEMIPLERIRHELGRAARAGATAYLVVNTANLRPVVMTTRAVMELAWDAKPWMAQQPDEASEYLRKWSTLEFGPKAAPVMVKYYQAYFDAPARYGKVEDAILGDNYYQTLSRQLLLGLVDPKRPQNLAFGRDQTFANLDDFAAFTEKIYGEADARWAEARRLARQAEPLIPSDRRPFFEANVIAQLDINSHSNRMLMEIASAVRSPDKAQREAKIESALEEGQEILRAMEAADYGKWKGFYTQGDWLLDVPLTLKLAQACLDQSEGRPVPENVVIRARDRGFAYHMITAYQGTQQVQF